MLTTHDRQYIQYLVRSRAAACPARRTSVCPSLRPCPWARAPCPGASCAACTWTGAGACAEASGAAWPVQRPPVQRTHTQSMFSKNGQRQRMPCTCTRIAQRHDVVRCTNTTHRRRVLNIALSEEVVEMLFGGRSLCKQTGRYSHSAKY